MFCVNCGKEISQGSNFCCFCGFKQPAPAPAPVAEPTPVVEPAPAPMQMQPMQTQPMPMQPMSPIPPAAPQKKKSKAGLIIILVLLLLLLAGGGVFAFLWMNRPITKVEAAFAEGDAQKVVELYGKVSEKDKYNVEVQAKEYALGLADSYLSDAEGADYETVSDNLQYLYDNILDGDDVVEDKINTVEKVCASRGAFKAAEQYKADGSYAEALEAYANVVSEDEACYDDAQTAIAQIKDSVRENAIAEAKDYVSYSDYDSAKDAIYDALAILPDDEDLMSELAEVEAAEVQEEINALLSDAADYAAREEYSNAVALLSDALQTYPGNADISKALETYQEELYASNPILGVWEMSFDVTEMVAEEANVDVEAMTVPFIIDLVFEFTEDGEYMSYVQEEELRETVQIWVTDIVNYAIDIMCEESGISIEVAQAFVKEVYGCSLEEFIKEEMSKEIDVEALIEEAISAMETVGVYETEGDKLYISETYIDYSQYDYYSIDGNTLTISLPEGEEFDTGIPGLEYPFTLTRVR